MIGKVIHGKQSAVILQVGNDFLRDFPFVKTVSSFFRDILLQALRQLFLHESLTDAGDGMIRSEYPGCEWHAGQQLVIFFRILVLIYAEGKAVPRLTDCRFQYVRKRQELPAELHSNCPPSPER
jgi:hypothetical protein